MFTHYIKSFILGFKKYRFFHTINLFGFSIGFLLLAIMLSYVYQELSFDKFHLNSNKIYRIHAGGYGVTPLCFADKLQDQVPEINNIIRFSSVDLSIEKENEILNIGRAYYTDPDIFQVFSFKLLHGDISSALKEPYAIVISEAKAEELFQTAFPIGETIKDKSGVILTVTGVMEDIPYNSHLQSEAFISIETLKQIGDENTFNCGAWGILTYVSLKKQSEPAEVEIKINDILEEFRMGTSEGKIPLSLEPLKEIYFDAENNKYDGSRHGNRQTVSLYLVISILVVLIVVINYINLSTAISAGKLKEIALKKINGARQLDIIKQSIYEAIFTAVLSCALAIAIIQLLFPQLCKLLNLQVSEILNKVNLYLLFLAVILIIGVITGLFTGVFMSRVNALKVLMKETVFKSRGIQRQVLLVFQMFIVATLLNSTFIINKQISYVLNKDLGFNHEEVVAFEISPELRQKKELIKNTLLESPDIEHVAFSDGLIGDGFAKAPIGTEDEKDLCYFFTIDPDFLELYDIQVKKGRNFSWEQLSDFGNSCILNEEACRVLNLENPMHTSLEDRIVVGVVNDFNFSPLHNRIEPLIMYCGDTGNYVQVKTSGTDQNGMIEKLSKIFRELSPDADFNFSYMDSRIKQWYTSDLDLKNSIQFYSIVALLLALLGLFGLSLFLIMKQRRDVSIRKLFGAKPIDTAKAISLKNIWIVLIANIISVPTTHYIMGIWLNNFQYRIGIEYLVFLKTLIITLSLTILAVSFVIMKAYKVNLLENLRNE